LELHFCLYRMQLLLLRSIFHPLTRRTCDIFSVLNVKKYSFKLISHTRPTVTNLTAVHALGTYIFKNCIFCFYCFIHCCSPKEKPWNGPDTVLCPLFGDSLTKGQSLSLDKRLQASVNVLHGKPVAVQSSA
jgi:hypothetical protein